LLAVLLGIIYFFLLPVAWWTHPQRICLSLEDLSCKN
jgi:hypothetical protein